MRTRCTSTSLSKFPSLAASPSQFSVPCLSPNVSALPRLFSNCSNSALRLLVRFIFQVNILSPKSPLSAFASIDLPVRKATILTVATFSLGFIPHLLLPVPSAGEPTQGYLHGGLLLDFIGQCNDLASS